MVATLALVLVIALSLWLCAHLSEHLSPGAEEEVTSCAMSTQGETRKCAATECSPY